MKRWAAIVPAVTMLVLVGLLAYGLTRDPHEQQSALINKSAPSFTLPTLADPDSRISTEKLAGQVVLVNVWASWCAACRTEVSLIQQLSQRTGVPVVGLDYKDSRSDAKRWLKQFGNPFAVVAFDKTGDIGVDWGVTGVPETFVLDKKGVIRAKIVGPITQESMRDNLLPTLKKLRQQT